MKSFLKATLLAAATLGVPFAAQAQATAWPTKPVKIVVPSPPGGSTDQIARAIGQKLAEAWGQPVVVENRPGAGLTLGADYVAKSAPDGYTLLMGAVHHSIAQSVYKKLPYDFGKDLAPITVLAIVPNVLIVSTANPAKNVSELIAQAKAQPGRLSYGSTGAGTAHHLIGEQFNDMAGTDILHVAYKGSSPALVDLMGGQTTMMFDTVASCLPLIKGGKLRPLAVATAKRSSALPEVPTLSEAGLTGFDIATWFGLMAPAGTPKAVIDKVYADSARILATPEMKKQWLEMGAEPVGNTPEQMNTQIKAEMGKFATLAAKAKLSLD
ncbi:MULTISPECIES: tripartite tricarboxylate transporter substrate binding protein [unclassified Variovorax]|uniref:Bug family tripartite tricarboxylate transporter substrate binding protein n=1 Tax=unclassified Variovorax TaxID=663243 RepID=UPI0025755378|nr:MULTISPECIES: tripartite tricarboxylate transporter substrate binding protein [unclassified Variovorax]MDM0091051.1 tripartite tricarboxylate transporter substrate binding protein [Variovorax sp. J22G40]MDM0148947.1 tripartite tricarboxylate transporter substrate binding protein [Variovorax sp. J2P1-31]